MIRLVNVCFLIILIGCDSKSEQMKYPLEVDGGINFETAPKAISAGANVLVAGTATFKGGQSQYEKNIKTLRGV